MSDIDFRNGFLCGLLGTGLGISGSNASGGSEGKLPSIEAISVVNLAAYKNVSTYIKANTYTTILSSSFGYMPKQGYVMIGGYDLYDFEGDDWSSAPRANVRIIVDGQIVFEGETRELFKDVSVNPPIVYQYQSSFDLVAKRLNLSDGMKIQLKETMIIGLK